MATLFQAGLNTTESNGTAVLTPGSGTGWSATTSGTASSIALTPPSGTSMPAIYVFQINSPAGYNFNGGTNLTWGPPGDATYGIAPYSDQAYLVAINGVSAPTSTPVGFTLNTQDGSAQAILDPTVSFNPPG